jgi:amino acid permease
MSFHAGPKLPGELGPQEWTVLEEPFIKDEDQADPDKGASLFSAVINSVKACLGAGILTLAWSFYFSSMWPGIVGTFALCVISAYSFWLLGVCSGRTGESSFGGMWCALFGSRWAWLPDMVIVLFLLCAAVSYLIIISDYLPRVLGGLGVPAMNRSVYILGSSFLILPLNFLEDLSGLSFTSVIGNFAILYTTCLLFYLGVTCDHEADWDSWVVQPGIFVTLPALAFSFNGHFTVPQSYQGLKAKSPKRWLTVTMFAYALVLPVMLVCSISGYYMFGSQLNLPGRSNVLMAMSSNGPEILVAYFAMTLSVLFNIPITTSCVRNALNSMWLRDIAPVLKIDADKEGKARKRIMSTIIVCITNFIALQTDALGMSVAVNGAVCATLMMYVFPAMMYMKSSTGGSWWLETALPVGSVALGAIMGVAGVATSFMLDAGMSSDLRW